MFRPGGDCEPNLPLVAAYYRMREAARDALSVPHACCTSACAYCGLLFALLEVDDLEKNPRADKAAGERRAQKARRKRATRRR